MAAGYSAEGQMDETWGHNPENPPFVPLSN